MRSTHMFMLKGWYENKANKLKMKFYKRMVLPGVVILGYSMISFYQNLYPPDDYFTPGQSIVNQLDYVTIVEPVNCGGRESTDLLVLTLSVFHNDERRDSIRSTWGSVSKSGTWPSTIFNYTVKHVFLLGYYDKPEANEKIKQEADEHGDILQIKYVETYQTPTTKILMGLKWMEEKCTNVRYVMKSDDDVFVNLPLIMALLERETGSYMLGDRLLLADTHRTGKHSVDYKAYPFFLYPSYLIGYVYAMPYSVAKKVYRAFYHVPQFSKYEDVFITGMLRKAVNAEIRQFHPSWLDVDKKVQLCDFVENRVIAAADLNIQSILAYWQTFTNASLCT